ncbi:6,7-dimethyl-8-ribityllumazine synthase [Lactobacillus intestinalis]|uniref:6,7-dimethyl-8-ribityllumazine synthase n=1 Tax=Lactobacillus intestinalis TaxID=151781 RepID=A0A4S2BQ92_9LACO|nr:6,7-dimethyl-8-ribityllumazine synthase [Lactobacillus intestinalis]TGY16881.1 6,7-dimethyl-8-ribityllumazine synthase [Lactobacillus intestinalis]
MTEYRGNFTNVHGKIAIVVAKFNQLVTKNLVSGAQETLYQFGIRDEDIDPGAFEIGFTAQKLLNSNQYAGIMSLGAVIKGETDHYNMIIQNITSALMPMNLEAKIPITFGILTTDNIDQALQRSGLKVGNEGSSTAQSLLEMISLNDQLN